MKRVGSFFLQVWLIGVMLSVPYYNWQYAREHGFMSWLFLGEVVATAKGFVWPYFWAPVVLEMFPQPDFDDALRAQVSTDGDLPKGSQAPGIEALMQKDYVTAVSEIRAAAERGDEISQLNLGSLYAIGQGVPQDYGEAVRWFRAAAEQGMREAQYALALSYDSGDGVPQDYELAAKWYRLCAEQAFDSCQHNLGILYANGQGVPKDQEQAYFWLELASVNGNEASGRLRDRVAKRISAQQIEQADARVRDWEPSTVDSADPSRQHSADVVAAAAFVREVLLLSNKHQELAFRLAGSTGQERTDLIAEADAQRRVLAQYAAVIDRDSVNQIYPELGSRLADQLLPSYVVARELLADNNPDRMAEVYSLQKEFADWFNPRMPDILDELESIPQTTSTTEGRVP